jgi:hypothetical protein
VTITHHTLTQEPFYYSIVFKEYWFNLSRSDSLKLFALDPSFWKLGVWLGQDDERILNPRSDGSTVISLQLRETVADTLTLLWVLAAKDAQADDSPAPGKYAFICKQIKES